MVNSHQHPCYEIVFYMDGEGESIINNELECDIVILSTGSKAYPNTGSDGIGYKLLNKFNLNIVKVTSCKSII